jgi:hypothetical protein
MCALGNCAGLASLRLSRYRSKRLFMRGPPPEPMAPRAWRNQKKGRRRDKWGKCSELPSQRPHHVLSWLGLSGRWKLTALEQKSSPKPRMSPRLLHELICGHL